MDFKRICVYCGSSSGVADRYLDAAREMGRCLADRGIAVVFGGGRVGMMGAVADAALEAGGEVYGVIPEQLKDLELAHDGLTELHVVDSMHARKVKMAELSDGFVALPGGWGTIEEIFEITTWTQLGYHRKPVGLLNALGYYDGLLTFLTHAADEGFIRPQHRRLLQTGTTPPELLDQLGKLVLPPALPKSPPSGAGA
ncbi:MAG: TIGR00730 family Rossman fold protein [Deltaproteobacteria bacterium]|nr:TIGR00730 family Rossman fold protein [Deltaproteobacteria bacterium]